MFIAIYNKDYEDNKEGNIHSKNVWEFAPIHSHLSKVKIPVELEGKEVLVSKVVDVPEKWVHQADTTLEQPTLEMHWNLNGSILFIEPQVDAWINHGGEIDYDSQPSIDMWSDGGNSVLVEQPMIPGYYYLISDSNNMVFHTSEKPIDNAWQNNEDLNDVVTEQPQDVENYTAIVIDDPDYAYQEESLDNSYSVVTILDDTYVSAKVRNPEATYYPETVNDYRYTYVPEVYHYDIVEDVDATEVALQLATEKAYEEAAQDLIDKCNNAMKYIVTYNTTQYGLGNMTSEDIDSLEEAFSGVLAKLQAYRPNKAAELIATLDLSSVAYGEEERSAILAILGY